MGNFCMLHLFQDVQVPAAEAMSAWEKSQVELALEQSLAENVAVQAQAAENAKLLDARLERMSYRRGEIAGDGNCQFAAICNSGQIPMTASQLRSQAVAYLRPLARFFVDRMENEFRERYGAYLKWMAEEGTWGDHLTLLASAHVLRRPITVVTTSASEKESEYCLEILPPSMIARQLWGPRIVICAVLDRHFDAAEKMDPTVPEA